MTRPPSAVMRLAGEGFGFVAGEHGPDRGRYVQPLRVRMMAWAE